MTPAASLQSASAASQEPAPKIRVLVVDDSAVVRKILTTTIAAEPDMEVVGTAPDAYVARDKILALKPDVMTLDIEMPRMSGLTFLKKLMEFHPMPVIVISSLGIASCHETLEALRYGAVDVLAKPAGPYSVGDLRLELAGKIRGAAGAVVQPRRAADPEPVVANPKPASARVAQFTPPGTISHLATPPPPLVTNGGQNRDLRQSALPDTRQIIAIGASTGGINAIQEVLTHLEPGSPGVVITQHIPPVFSLAFARRLDQLFPFEVKEAEDGDKVYPGRVLIAPGNYHMLLRRAANGYFVEVTGGPQVCYQRPSVDVMFASVAEAARENAVGVLLTGMGADGAQGMLTMHTAGARTIAQDETSCVVYGMPREAVRLGGVDRIVPLANVGASIGEALRRKR